jgi:hypothetical protein
LNAGADQSKLCPGTTVTLDATPLTPAVQTITWTQVGVPFVELASTGDPTTFKAPTSSLGDSQFLTFKATGSAGGFDPGSDTVLISTRSVTVSQTPVGTKSSGAAKPLQTVTIDLADNVVATSAAWVQDPADIVRVTLTPIGERAASFVAPTVQATTDLHFLATAVYCPVEGEDTQQPGSPLTVSIQVGTVALNLPDLPAGVEVGVPYDLTPFASVGGGAPTEYSLLFRVSDNGALPPGVDVITNATDVDIVDNGITIPPGYLLVRSGTPGQVLTILVQLLGTAGLLDEASGTLTIVAGGG